MSYFCKLKGKLSPLLSQAGLSLLETAIGLVIVGTIVASIVQVYRQQLAEDAYETNLGNLHESLDGINQFFVSGNSFYPCPTDLSLSQGDVGFGASGDCSVANFPNIKLCTDPTWFVNGGICKTSDVAASAVIIGGVPFADLKMTPEEVLDFWGNKLIYAVSRSQTEAATYVYEGGSIDIMTVDDPDFVALGTEDGLPDIWPDAQDLFIFSTGRAAIGGYTSNGVPLTACGNATYEDENCDFDDIFFARQGPEDTDFSAYSEGDNNTYFDDMTVYQMSPPVGTWFQHSKNPLYVSTDFVLTGATKVTVNSTDNNPSKPISEVNLEVEGDLRADVAGGGLGGHLRSSRYCRSKFINATTAVAADCVDPRYVTDAEDSMNCVESGPFANSVIRGVRKVSGSANVSSVGCSTGTNTGAAGGVPLQVDKTKFIVVNCAADGKVAVGINAAGDIQCAAIP